MPDQFFDNLDIEFDSLADRLSQGLLSSYFLGLDQVGGELGPTKASFTDPIGLGFDVTPDEAVEYFKQKKVVTRRQFDLLSEDARSAAFTVAGVYRQDVLRGFKDEIASALETGAAQATVIKRFRDILAGAGQQQLGAFHLETIFRTNMQVAYGVGRRRAMEETAEDLPFWQYHTAGDDRVRPTHAVLNGLVLPANHEFWNSHYPPWSFNCRCAVTATDEIPQGYSHHNPSGEAEIFYDHRGLPAKAEMGTTVYDLAVGDFGGIPNQGTLKAVIQAGVKRSQSRKLSSPKIPKPKASKKVPTLAESLERHELTIVNRRTEMAITLDPTGSVVFKKTNRAVNYVTFNSTEIAKMKGMIVTHNHPNGSSLSTPDVRLAMRAQMAEMRAVGKTYRYSMKPGPGGWNEDLWNNVVAREVRFADQEVRNDLLPAVNAGKMTEHEAQLRHMHEVWSRVARRTGLIYERTTW